MTDLEQEILREANRARAAQGLRRLTADSVLARVARSYSQLMAERQVFSHFAPIEGMEDLAQRVRSSGGNYDGLGENIAMHPTAQSRAQDFIDGWLSSPGHRANLLAPDWEVSGVGVHATDDGIVLATQLFGIPVPIALREPTLDLRPVTWYSLELSARIGAGYSLGAFVRNQFMVSAAADGRGQVRLECEIPIDPGLYHVGFGRRRTGSSEGWIGVHDGVIEIMEDGGAVWRPAPNSHDDILIENCALFRVSGAELVLKVAGEARIAGIMVVNGIRQADLGPGEFEACVAFRAGTGQHRVDIGVTEDDECYRVVRRFDIDADRGEVSGE